MTFDAQLGRAEADTCVLAESANGKRLRERWLGRHCG
jgi:hypothetical protein